jgi:hypothetical protein
MFVQFGQSWNFVGLVRAVADAPLGLAVWVESWTKKSSLVCSYPLKKISAISDLLVAASW